MSREITAFMQELAAEPIGGSPPKATFVWWKAQLARRWDAEHRASAPVRIDECLCAGLAALAGIGLAAWWWATSPLIATPVVAAASIAGVLVLLASALLVVGDLCHDGSVHSAIRRSGDLKSPNRQVTK